MRSDSHLLSRCAAAVSKESNRPNDPWSWAFEHSWELASTPGWDSAWESGRVLREEELVPPGQESAYPPIGYDAGVITDEDILARIQQLLP